MGSISNVLFFLFVMVLGEAKMFYIYYVMLVAVIILLVIKSFV